MDIQELVGKDHSTKYFPVSTLNTYEPGNPHFKQVGEFSWLDDKNVLQEIKEDQGVIISLEGTRRPGFVHRHMGREVTPIEAEEIRSETSRRVPEFAVWDYKITEVLQTDGPEARRELLESYESKRKREGRERDQQADGINVLGKAIEKMTSVMQPGEPQTTEQLMAQLQDQLSPSQVEEMLVGMAENPKGKKK